MLSSTHCFVSAKMFIVAIQILHFIGLYRTRLCIVNNKGPFKYKIKRNFCFLDVIYVVKFSFALLGVYVLLWLLIKYLILIKWRSCLFAVNAFSNFSSLVRLLFVF